MHRSHRRRTPLNVRPATTRRATTRAVLEAIEPRQLLTVNIQFDYSLDSSGFFTDPSRRALLQQAADEVTAGMTDALAPITPSGSDTWSISFNDPSTGNQTTINNPSIPADTIVIYAGSHDLADPILGLGGFAGYSTSGSTSFENLIRSRGNPGALLTPSRDFAPFAGSIAFDNNSDFYFGTNTNSLGGTQNDFLSVAEHELVHVLGIPGARSFDRYVTNHTFTGPKAEALYGAAVPLENDDNHLLDGTNVNGEEALMDPSLTTGTRKTITELDQAILDDIGWDYDVPGPPTVSIAATDSKAAEPNSNGEFTLTRTGSLAATLGVDVTVTGTATRGTDYDLAFNGSNTTSNHFTFPIGEAAIKITLDVRDDLKVEDNETAIIQVADGGSYSVGGAPATVTIDDDDLARTQANRVPPVAVDMSTSGNTSDLGARDLHLSAGGRYATFISNSTNLVGSPLTTYYQVYRRDIVGGTTRLVSIADGDATEANADAVTSRISADGRFVAFETTATDIVGDDADTNVVSDVYLKDLDTNQTWLISRNRAGAVGGELVDISRDGEQVLFRSSTKGSAFVKGLVDQNGGDDLFVWNRRTGRFSCVTLNAEGTRTGDRPSTPSTLAGDASFSTDGNFVVFPSRASDLVAGVTDGNTFGYDVFVRDLGRSRTDYASISTDADTAGNGTSGNAEITADGRYVIFRSSATNLVSDTFDKNETQDVFVRDRIDGTTKLISMKIGGGSTSNGGTGMPDITDDGRFAVFTSTATDMLAIDSTSTSDAYLFDLTNGHIELLSLNNGATGGGNAGTVEVKISDDGTRAVFASYADDLPGDFDKRDTDFTAIYSRDLTNDRNSVLSFDRGDNPAGANSSDIVISADGTRAGYSSASETLVKGDVNNTDDLFVNSIPGHESAYLDPETGHLTVNGSPINDTISIQRINSTVVVRRNNERLEFKASAINGITVLGGDGDDSVVLGTNLAGGAYVSAGSGNDTVQGSDSRDNFQGGPGRDLLYGGDGNDRIDGGKGNDTIYGEEGDDNLFGSDSDDHIYGGSGRDRLSGNVGSDTLDAGGSNDRFYGDDAFVDLFLGGTGNDTAVRKDSNDILDSVENG